MLYDAEHDLARGLQQALLTVTVLRVPQPAVAARYLPAAHGTIDIGGAFHDQIRLGDTSATVICDVQVRNATSPPSPPPPA
ncbi:hypothetical protein [Streptomyces sp. NPDC058486]|uniref:hypothetical protein n=1 Tax=unclassified Streptomyces TaxID=2593676 RepID=UPI00365F3189